MREYNNAPKSLLSSVTTRKRHECDAIDLMVGDPHVKEFCNRRFPLNEVFRSDLLGLRHCRLAVPDTERSSGSETRSCFQTAILVFSRLLSESSSQPHFIKYRNAEVR